MHVVHVGEELGKATSVEQYLPKCASACRTNMGMRGGLDWGGCLPRKDEAKFGLADCIDILLPT